LKLVDVRSPDAYIGWQLRNEPRRGHIDTAMNLPAEWSGRSDWNDIVKARGVRPDDAIIVYDYDADTAERIAEIFSNNGYKNVRVYRDFLNEWNPDPELPMAYLNRYMHLVSAGWLNGLIRGENVPEYDNRRYIVCHAHYRNPDDYLRGHIPGAVALDTNLLEMPGSWNRRTPAELTQALTGIGINSDTTVILYGRTSDPETGDQYPGSSAGQLAAMRCAFIMLYAGVADVRILNGGLNSWTAHGLPLSTEETVTHPVTDFGLRVPAHPEIAVDLSQARNILRTSGMNLVSVRSEREYRGEVSGYSYIEKKGHIPGSVFGNSGSDAYHMENYRNPDQTMREYHEIEKRWYRAGITPDKFNAFYCGTGWRASEAFFDAWLMDWPRIAVYDGGWLEWVSDPDNPVETSTAQAG
jgi:3-mercaptopyruvate sulfurtransferase SseA